MTFDFSQYLKFNNHKKLDVILQAESAECGFVCILMIANHFGYKIDLTSARRDFSISLKGLTLSSMVEVAKKIELTARPLKLDLEDVPDLVFPVIIHWNLNHFVVLESYKNGTYEIIDPAKGRIKVTSEEFSNSFTGIALELIPSKNFKAVDKVNAAKLSDMWGKVVGLKRSLTQLLLISIIIQSFVLMGPLFNQFVIDEAVTKLDSSILLPVAIGLLLVGLFQSTMGYVRSKLMLFLTNHLNIQMTVNLYSHLVRLPADYFEKRKIGDIVTRFGSLGPIQSLISDGFVAIILDSILAIFSLVIALFYSLHLTFLIIFFLLLNIAISYITFPYSKRKSEEILECSAKEQSIFLENIQASMTIKIYGHESTRESLWINRKTDLMNENITLANFSMKIGFLVGLLATFQSVLILYLGSKFVIDGVMSLGMLFAYQSYSSQFSGRFSSLVDKFFAFKMLGMHLQRLADIVHTEREDLSKSILPLDTKDLDGTITFQNVSFRYADSEP